MNACSHPLLQQYAQKVARQLVQVRAYGIHADGATSGCSGVSLLRIISSSILKDWLKVLSVSLTGGDALGHVVLDVAVEERVIFAVTAMMYSVA